jgi:pimeloyl-ACP methyl ester carboxylesterase
MQSHEIHIQGNRIHVGSHGSEAPPVLMLHSTGLGSTQWLRLARKLRPRRCLLLDFFGYGRSEACDELKDDHWLVDQEAARSLLLAEEAPCDLVGHSYGGHIALMLAHDHPDRVRKVAVHEPIAWGVLQADGPQELREDFVALCQRLFPEPALGADEWLRRFVDYWNQPGTWNGLTEQRKKSWLRSFFKIHSEVKSLCFEPKSLAYYRELRTPVTITCSRGATPHAASVCQMLSEAIPQATFVETEGAHLAPITHPESVLPALIAGLAPT